MALGSSYRFLSCMKSGYLTMLFSRELVKSRIRTLEPSLFSSLRPLRCVHKDKDGDNNELESNPFFGKYADKIKQAEREGRSQKTKNNSHFSDSNLEKEAKVWAAKIGKFEKSLEKNKSESEQHGSHLPQNLDSILKLEKIKDKSSEQIQELWRIYFKDKDCISAVIPIWHYSFSRVVRSLVVDASTYERIKERAESCPMFLYPLPRSDGYEFILSQFTKDVCHFTSLISFQAHGDNAPWQLKLRHYPELKESKGIVLMTSEVDIKTLSIVEAQCLAQQLQMFYATSDEERFAIVHSFNHSPDKFDYHNLIREIETSGILMPAVSPS